ncbi:hypothetical protein EDB83DRAFT_2315730 [Lactarius deliciosus]|nr:hypothetical protein EDB83DRAFT_2315730 [Lactarius deliciosus]
MTTLSSAKPAVDGSSEGTHNDDDNADGGREGTDDGNEGAGGSSEDPERAARAVTRMRQGQRAVKDAEWQWTGRREWQCVTVSPQTDPRAPYVKTPNTVRRRTAEDDADEQAEIRRLVADHAQDRAKSPTPHYIPGSAHRRDPEFWE